MKTPLNHIYGCTTRENGNMATFEARQSYLRDHFGDVKVFASEQIHGNTVKMIAFDNAKTIESGCDGLVYRDVGKRDRIVLTMRSADCPIVVAWDDVYNVIGICHAGWKGIIHNMVPAFIDSFIHAGAHISKVSMYISPHIHSCCYEFSEPEIQYFIHKYPEGVVKQVGNKYYIDLANAICLDAVNHGILNRNVEISPHCTSCQVSEYYSYRRRDSSLYGEMMTFIGLL